MAVTTVVKTIGATGAFSTVQLWHDGAPTDLTTAEQSACGTFLVSTFVQGEALTFVGSGATGVMLDTDSTGPGTGTYMTYGITLGNPAAADVITGTSTATCVLTSGTPDFTGIIWQGQCQNQDFSAAGNIVIFSGKTVSATTYLHLTTVSGASFKDHATASTNPLRIDGTKGATLTSTGGATSTVGGAGTGLRLSNLQIRATGAASRALSMTSLSGVIENCIIEGTVTAAPTTNATLQFGNGSSCTVRNTVVIQRASAADHIITTQTGTITFASCTIVAPDDFAAAPTSIFTSGLSGTVTVQNCGLFAGDSAKALTAGSATFNFTTCASDISGTAGVTQVTYNREFQDVNDATADFKLRPGASQINAGTIDTTNAATDIIGTTRPKGPTYDIGAWEFTPGPTLWAGGMM